MKKCQSTAGCDRLLQNIFISHRDMHRKMPVFIPKSIRVRLKKHHASFWKLLSFPSKPHFSVFYLVIQVCTNSSFIIKKKKIITNVYFKFSKDYSCTLQYFILIIWVNKSDD